MFLDVHLMIYNPYDYIEAFVESGARFANPSFVAWGRAPLLTAP